MMSVWPGGELVANVVRGLGVGKAPPGWGIRGAGAGARAIATAGPGVRGDMKRPEPLREPTPYYAHTANAHQSEQQRARRGDRGAIGRPVFDDPHAILGET